MAKRIETELIIKAVDQYTATLNKMSGVTGKFASKVRTEMSQLQDLRGSLKLIEDFKKQQEVVRKAGEELSEARERVRRLGEEMRRTENPSKKMREEMGRAQRTANRLEEAHDKQRRTLNNLRTQLRETGVRTNHLGDEQRRLTNDINSASGAMDRQIDRLGRMDRMQNTIAQGRERMDRSLARAANLSFAGHAAMQSGQRILGTTVEMADRGGDLQDKFSDFKILAQIDDTEIENLHSELLDLRDTTKMSVGEMLDALFVFVGKGMDYTEAKGALVPTARAAKAEKTPNSEMGAAGFAISDNLNVAPEDLDKSYDTMAEAGKQGGFELSDMAKWMPQLTAVARALKMEGNSATAEIAAALQISMKSAGSTDQAANNLSNFMAKLTAPDTIKNFEKFGVNVERELARAGELGISQFEHMINVINEKTGGDGIQMSKLFRDKQALDFLRAMIPNLEEYARIKDAALSADGVIDADFAEVLDQYNESKAQLGEAWSTLLTPSPETLETLTELLQKADAFVEKLIIWKKEHPELSRAIFLGAAAMGTLAVAAGALLIAAAGLIGTMAVLKFGLISLGARAAMTGGDIASIGANMSKLGGRRPVRLSRLIAPVRWTAGLIPRIPWVGAAGRLSWKMLITPLAWAGRGALRFIPVIGWALLAGELSWHLLIKPLGWDKYLPKIDWSKVKGSFSWEDGIPVIDWSKFAGAFSWDNHIDFVDLKNYVKDVDWKQVIKKFSWNTVFVPFRIQRFMGKVVWKNVIEPLGWDEFVPKLNWKDKVKEMKWSDVVHKFSWLDRIPGFSWSTVLKDVDPNSFVGDFDWSSLIPEVIWSAFIPEISWGNWFNFNWSDFLPEWSWSFIPSINIGKYITWPSPPAWFNKLTGSNAATKPKVQERAVGGSFNRGWRLVGEKGPELEYVNRSGFIAHHGQLQKMDSMSRNIRRAGLAGIAASTMMLPAAAQVQAPSQSVSGLGSPPAVNIEFNGGITIQVPQSMTDPQAIAEIVISEIGDRVSKTIASSYSD